MPSFRRPQTTCPAYRWPIETVSAKLCPPRDGDPLMDFVHLQNTVVAYTTRPNAFENATLPGRPSMVKRHLSLHPTMLGCPEQCAPSWATEPVAKSRRSSKEPCDERIAAPTRRSHFLTTVFSHAKPSPRSRTRLALTASSRTAAPLRKARWVNANRTADVVLIAACLVQVGCGGSYAAPAGEDRQVRAAMLVLGRECGAYTMQHNGFPRRTRRPSAAACSRGWKT
jgi:hypothetical protein